MSAAEPTTRGVAETARSYFESIARHDLEAMVSHWKPGASGSIHGMVELTAPDNYREWFGGLFAAFPDLEFEILDVVAEGDKAAVRWRAAGTFTGGDFEGMIANGSSVEMEGCDVVTIRDGLIVDNRAYMNAADMARQLGVMPAQGSPGERAMLGALNLKTRLSHAVRRH
ncbi:MAG: ester cyclase [Solirubrobacterales bacterium]